MEIRQGVLAQFLKPPVEARPATSRPPSPLTSGESASLTLPHLLELYSVDHLLAVARLFADVGASLDLALGTTAAIPSGNSMSSALHNGAAPPSDGRRALGPTS